MFKNYLMVAVRNLMQHKVYSLINVLGLAVGMACCVLIGLYVWHELSYDCFHEKADRIYRVVGEYENDVTGDMFQIAATPYRLTELLREQFPDIAQVVRLYGNSAFVRYGDQAFSESHLYFADAHVFDVFSFRLIKGDPKTALLEPHTIVVTEAMAQKFFGDEDPMGKVLWVGEQMPEVRVTGVMQTLSDNSHIKVNALLSMAVAKDLFSNTTLHTWRNGLFTYVLLRQRVSYDVLVDKLPVFVDELRGMDAPFLKLILQPLTQIHLRSNGVMMILIALLTVGYQTWRAARMNPVDALRCE